MKAVVMAGGYGTRLRPLTIKRPKPMIPVANVPMLEHIVRLLIRHGFSEILMLTYFFPESIEEHFGDGSRFGVRITYHQDPPGGLGTAGAVRAVADIIDGPFLVISGDVITDFDLTQACRFHSGRGELATMVLTRVHNPLPFGVVITDEGGKVSKFLEKPSWGEVFSDTINTGIYIMQPEVLDRIEPRKNRDFSKDVFPGLLAEGNPPGAYVAEGYWKDVGNSVEYLQLHREIASGTIVLDIPGEVVKSAEAIVYVAEGARVSEDATLAGLVVVGAGATVGEGARIRDSFIGPGSTVAGAVRMRSSVLWEDVKVGKGAFVAGSVIGSGTEIRTRANVEEGATVGDDCVVGRGSIVRSGVRVWPDKVVEDDAVLSSDFIWGTRWRGTLFTSGIISGLANREITPEFMARLGAAFGATLPDRSAVSLSLGMHRLAKMMGEAIAAGILSVGIDVHDCRIAPLPVARHQIKAQGDVGGIHVRRAPSDPEILEVRFYREEGRELTTAERNEIDRMFFRMDFKRATVDNSGTISAPEYSGESYEKIFLRMIDLAAIEAAPMRLVVDYSFGSTLKVLPALLGRTRCEVVSLNAHRDEEKVTRTTKQFDRAVRQLSQYIVGLSAGLGAIVSASGETLFLLDERGRWIDGGKMLQAISLLAFRTSPGCVVAVPASASGNLERIAEAHGGGILRTPVNPSAILDTAATGGAFMAGNGEGGIAFTGFHPSFDAMFCLVKSVEMLARTGETLGALVDSLPDLSLEHSIVTCPWEAKGQVMRRLVEELGDEAKGIEGVRFEDGDGWVLIYPSSNHACFNIYAESATPEGVREKLKVWSRKVEAMQK